MLWCCCRQQTLLAPTPTVLLNPSWGLASGRIMSKSPIVAVQWEQARCPPRSQHHEHCKRSHGSGGVRGPLTLCLVTQTLFSVIHFLPWGQELVQPRADQQVLTCWEWALMVWKFWFNLHLNNQLIMTRAAVYWYILDASIYSICWTLSLNKLYIERAGLMGAQSSSHFCFSPSCAITGLSLYLWVNVGQTL